MDSGSYGKAISEIRSAFGQEPDKAAAIIGVLDILVDRIRQLEGDLASADRTAAKPTTLQPGGGPLRG